MHADDPEKVLQARSDYLDALAHECGDPAFDRFTAQLIFTELVGNVMRHSHGPVDVQVHCVAGKALLHVFDRGTGFVLNPKLPAEALEEGGRGLYLVSQFADRVNVHTMQGHGTCVSAVFHLGRHARAG